jgi:hypothetical protein
LAKKEFYKHKVCLEKKIQLVIKWSSPCKFFSQQHNLKRSIGKKEFLKARGILVDQFFQLDANFPRNEI